MSDGPAIPVPLRLAGRFARSRPVRRAGSVVLITSASLITLLTMLAGFTQSGPQIVEQDLGRFGARLDLGSVMNVPAGDDRALRSMLDGPALRHTTLLIQSFDLRVDGGSGAPVNYGEGPWRGSLFPQRYQLGNGRWPTRPGEIVVSPDVVGVQRSRVALFSGRASLRVVGQVNDRYASGSEVVLAAPGTWHRFPWPQLAAGYPTLAPTPVLFWSGGTRQVLDEVAQELRAQPATNPRALDRRLREAVRTRRGELTRERLSWNQRLPIVYRLPAFLLPVLATLVSFALNAARLRRNHRVLTAVGLGPRLATSSVLLAGSAWALLATIAGVPLGAAAGALARTATAPLQSGPPGPVPDLWRPTGQMLVLVLATCTLALLYARLGPASGHARRLVSAAPRPTGKARRLLLLGVLAVLLYQLATLHTVTAAMSLVATTTLCGVLLVPDLLPRMLGLIPERGPLLRLARRHLLLDRDRSVMATVVLAAVLGPALAMLILLQSLTASAENQGVADVPPGQLRITTSSLASTPPQALVSAVGSAVRPGHVVYLSFAVDAESAVQIHGGGPGAVMVVPEVRDAARLSNFTLTSAQRHTLSDGGMLVWDGRGGHQATLELANLSTGSIASSHDIPSTDAPFPRPWQAMAAGLMVARTARTLSLPVTTSDVVMTGVTERQAGQARDAAGRAGYDPSMVRIYRPPESAAAPAAFWTAVAGLTLFALAVCITVAIAQASAMRARLSGLVAVGLTPGWARRVLQTQSLLLGVLSSSVGLVVAVVPVVAAALVVPNIVLAVPWARVAVLLLGYGCALLIATAAGTRALRARDRSKFSTQIS